MAATGDFTPAAAASGAGEDASSERWDKSRVEIFSDGVFAIAITLLVLDISVAPADFENLRHALLHEWPAYLAYVISFLTVGSVWIAHHGLFSRLRFVDPTLLRLNLLLLMTAAFLPFPTSVLARALHADDTAERTAVVFYGAAALVIELVLRTAVRYAESRPELTALPAGAVPAPPSRGGWRMWLGLVLYAAAILFGVFLFPKVAVVSYLLVAVRGVFVVGSEGRLSLSFRWMDPRRWFRS
jgi:uncharacterized membrane protein